MARLLALLPRPLRRRVPPLGWWLLKRLPPRAASAVARPLMRSLYAAVQRRGASADPDFMGLLFAEDVEWVPPPTFPDAGSYSGHAGVHEEITDFLDVWAELDTTIRDVQVDPRAELMRVSVRQAGRARRGGVGATFDEVHVYHVRSGRARRVEMFVV